MDLRCQPLADDDQCVQAQRSEKSDVPPQTTVPTTTIVPNVSLHEGGPNLVRPRPGRPHAFIVPRTRQPHPGDGEGRGRNGHQLNEMGWDEP